MYASFQNVMFIFDNGTDDDLSTYEYELYEEEDIANPNTPPYTLQSGAVALSTGSGNASVFAVPVTGSYVDESGDVQQKNFFGRVRAIDTSGNVSQWTSIVKTDPSTPLIDSQYIVSLTADKIKAGTIESAEIVLGGANPSETIIKSLTYDTSSGAQGWFIRGDGHFSLGGPDGITYNNSTITIGSDVQVQANLAADSISVGSGQNQLNINDGINGGAGGMTLGDPSYNYWYANGQFRVGDSSKSFSFTSGNLSIANASLQLGSVAANDYATITQNGDFTVVGYDGSTGSYGTSTFYGPWFNVKKNLPGVAGGNAQLMWDNLAFFKASPAGSYGVYIAGGNSGGNAFIDVGSTGITDGNSISCSGWFRSSGTSGWYNQTYGGGIWMDDSSTVKVYGNKNFYTAGTISAGVISSDGYITTDDLYINGNKSNGPAVRIDRYVYNTQNAGWDNRYIQFVNADTGGGGPFEAGSVTVNGSTSVRYNTSSDIRVKTNIEQIQNPLTIIKNINPVEFSFIQEEEKRHHGFLAQDLYQSYSYPVSAGDYSDSVERMWSIDYGMLTPLLTAAIKELLQRVEELESRLV